MTVGDKRFRKIQDLSAGSRHFHDQNGHVAHLFEIVRSDNRQENSSNGDTSKRLRTSESIMRTISVEIVLLIKINK
jgi:hypothetical protein